MIAALVKNWATVALVTFCIFLFGVVTYVDLPREASPDVDIPVVMVITPYPGVSPEDIESLVTNPIENELAGVADLKKMSSTSSEGASMITLEFEPEAVIEEALQVVRDRVSRARAKLPADAEETDVREVSFSDVPIMIVSLAGPVDGEVLKTLGEELEDEVSRIPGVLEANLSGGRTREIKVYIDPVRLSHYSLSINDVIGAIGDENVNIPGGNVTAGDARFLLRVPGDVTDPAELENIAVKRRGDRPVFIRDVGRVVDGFAEVSSYSRMNGERAVSLAVKKRTGANILELATQVKAVAREHEKTWPEGVSFRVLGDQSEMVNDMVSELENGIITALILVVGVILFFMGVRNSLFVAISIPLSMLMSFLFIAAFGMTLNMMVLFALILALGMLVDNAIVLVENIYRHVEEGKDLRTASIDGTKEVALAVTASTATTVGAFAPMVFWGGIMGQFMGYLPKTVIIVLVCSLAVAVGILPVFTAKFMGKANPRQQSDTGSLHPSEQGPLVRLYRASLEWALTHRYVTMALGMAVLIGSVMAYGALNHGTEFFPDVEPDRATVTVRAPDGTDLEATDRIVRQVEAILAKESNVDFFVAETGVAGGADPMASSEAASNQARITVDFLPHPTKVHEGETARTEDARDTIDRIRGELATIAGASIVIEKERMGPPVGAQIAVELHGDDFHKLGRIAERVRRDLSGIEGATGLRDDYRVGRPEMRLRIDRGAAKRVGASTRAVAGAVRSAVAGTKASSFRDGEDEYDIMVSLEPAYRDDLQAVLAMRIPGREDTSPDTYAVPLSAVASYELAGGSGSIRHIDQELVVTISGDVAEGYNENVVRDAVSKYIDGAEMPEGFFLRLGGAQDEQRAAQEFLGRAFMIAVFLILLVLVAQFNRFDIPGIILFSVVMSLVGVLWGLILTGTPFGVIMTGIGVISLAGVVVNNAIVLLDYVEQLRASGRDLRDALVQAGITRLRPVLLTAITTILGLVPMAIGASIDFKTMTFSMGSQSAQWWGPMAVAVIFGLAFATVLTLILVPTAYNISEDVMGLLKRLVGRKSEARPETFEAPPQASEAE